MLNVFSVNKQQTPVKKKYTSIVGQNIDTIKSGLNYFSQPKVQPTQNIEPNRSTQKILGSSEVNPAYAGYKKDVNPMGTTPPPVIPKPETNVIKQQDASTNWLNYGTDAALKKQALVNKQLEDKKNFLNQGAQLANQQLQEQLPEAQKQFSDFKTNAEATISDLLAGGERQKAQATDYQGEAQRAAAQTRRETQAQSQKTFANLNTLDSRGEGSFGQATENADSEFNRYTQQGLKALADKKSEIDATVSQAERNARATITQEEAKMNKLARDIQYAIAGNNLQQASDLTDAFNTSQQLVYDIEDSVAQMKYQFGLEQQKLENEIAKTSTANLSQQFLQTGKPQTAKDTEYIFNNPAGATAYQKLLGSSEKPKNAAQLQVEGKSGAGLRALDTIETEILNNPSILMQAALPGSPAARQYEAAVSSLTDAIGGLRTGASVSPDQQKFYRNLIPKVGDSQQTIDYKLNSLRQELGSYQQGAANMGTELPPELMTLLGL